MGFVNIKKIKACQKLNFWQVFVYGEIWEKRYSSVRGGCQRGAGTEGIGEKPKSPYNLFNVGGGVRRETGKEKFLRTWRAPERCWYGGNWGKAKNLRTTCFMLVVEYGENREKRDSSVRSESQEDAGTEEMGEKPKSPYNLFNVGGGVRRKTGKEKFLRTWWEPERCWYGGNERKAKNLRTTCFMLVVEYGENREKRNSSVRGGCQRGASTEEIGEKPKISVQLVLSRW